jgi:catechol 2,3-dioxygenase-like lactoylglutathione lyase family enzyme
MLSTIVAVTLLVPDVEAVERAYQQVLDYQTVERGHVAADLAESWGTKALAGREFVVLQPSSREPVYLRMVETDAAPAPALKTLGWNATELLVEDPALLERRLAGSPFRVIGPPAPLDFNPAVVAMQALGPAGELLYFTRMPDGVSKFGLGSATSFVDRVFIVVLAVHDIRGTLDFYAATFGLSVTEPASTRVEILAEAWGLPREQSFLLGIVRLPERFLIEVDEYPAAAPPRMANCRRAWRWCRSRCRPSSPTARGSSHHPPRTRASPTPGAGPASCSVPAASTSNSSRPHRPGFQRSPVMASRDVRRASLDPRG